MNNPLHKRHWFIAIAAPLLIAGQFYCAQPEAKTADAATPKTPTREETIARGKYIVSTSGCNDCHSPKILTPTGPVLDTTKILSGHPGGVPPVTYDATKPGSWMLFSPDLTAAVGPWGMSFAANLTPDSATGIGAWTNEVFIKTLRSGKHLGQEGGRPILPPMPWQEVAHMTDEDLSAIFAYLQSLPPIKNQVPAPIPPTDVMKAKP
jgi:mono/diheme cytochrome c family protein